MGIFQLLDLPKGKHRPSTLVSPLQHFLTSWVSPLGSTMVFVPPRPNGTLPGSVEIQNNTIYFKGPVSYSVAGTYVCEATNAIGTRSGLVEVNVTGRTAPGCSGMWKRRWGGRGGCEQFTATTQFHLLNHQRLLSGVGISWCKGGSGVLGFVLVLHWFALGSFSPFLLWSFPFLHQFNLFPSRLLLWIQRDRCCTNSKDTAGRY